MVRKERIKAEPSSAEVEAAVLAYARDYPDNGQARAALDLTRSGFAVSPSGVRIIWLRHGLETAFKRLKNLARQAGGNAAFSERQREILKRGEAGLRLVRRAQRAGGGEDGAEARDRREQIMLAAAQLFVEHGYAGTSVRQIADRAGMLPGSVYHHFSAKEDLFIAIQRESFRRLARDIESALKESKDPWERLELACAEHIHDVAAGNPIAQVTATGLFAIHEQRLQRRLKADREAYDELFRRLVADLELPAGVDRSLFRLTLLGALNWTHVWYRPGKLSPRQIAGEIIGLLRGRSMRLPKSDTRK